MPPERQTPRQRENAALVRDIVAAVDSLIADGVADSPAALAAALNGLGIYSRTGRDWTAAGLAKFLASPGARRAREE